MTYVVPATTAASPVVIADKPTGGSIGTAATTVDVSTTFVLQQSTATQELTIPPLTAANLIGRAITFLHKGTAAGISIRDLAATPGSGTGVLPGAQIEFVWDGTAWSADSPATRLISPDGTKSVAVANAGTTVNGPLTLGSVILGNAAAAPTAAASVDIASTLIYIQTTSGISFTLPAPTSAVAGRELVVVNRATATTVLTVNGLGIAPGTSTAFVWDGAAWTAPNYPGSTAGLSLLRALGGGVQTISAPGVITMSSNEHSDGTKITRTGNQLTLQPGKYRLSGGIGYFNGSIANSYILWQLRNVTTGLLIGTKGQVDSDSATATGAPATQEARAVITVSAPTVVQLEVVGGDSYTSIGTAALPAWVCAEEMPTATTVNPGNVPVQTLSKVIATAPTGQAFPANTGTVVTGWTAGTNIGGAFNSATGVFTAPRAGQYTVTFGLRTAAFTRTIGGEFTLSVNKNGTSAVATSDFSEYSGAAYAQTIVSGVIDCNAGDTLTCMAGNWSGVATSLLSQCTMSISEQASATVVPANTVPVTALNHGDARTTSVVSTTSTTYVDATGMSVTLPAAGKYNLLATIQSIAFDQNENVEFVITDGSNVEVSDRARVKNATSATGWVNSGVTLQARVDATAGAVYKVRWRSVTGTPADFNYVDGGTQASSRLSYTQLPTQSVVSSLPTSADATITNQTGNYTLTASTTVDTCGYIRFTQSTADRVFTIPNPSTLTQMKTVTLQNIGTATMVMQCVSGPSFYLYPNQSHELAWNGSRWCDSDQIPAAYPEIVYGNSWVAPSTPIAVGTSSSATPLVWINIPTAGTWEITPGIRVNTGGASAGVSICLYNSTGTTLIPNSERLVAYGNNMQATCAAPWIVTTTGYDALLVKGFSDVSAGSLQDNLAGHSTLVAKKIANFAPIQGTSVDYWHGKVAANSITTTPNDVPLTALTGNMAATSPHITLRAGKTYALEADLSLRATWATYQWVDNANVPLPNSVLGLNGSFNSTDGASPTVAYATITPTVDTQVKVRLIGAAALTMVDSIYSTIKVTQLGSTAITSVASSGTASADITNQATSTTLTAASTVDTATYLRLAQTTAGVTLTIPTPSVAATCRTVTLDHVGTARVGVICNPGDAFYLDPNRSRDITWTGTRWNAVDANLAVMPEYGSISVTGGTISSASYADIPGSTFTLPSDGTWEVAYALNFTTATTGVGVQACITDTANVIIAGSADRFVTSLSSATYSLTQKCRITTTGPTTYKLRANGDGSNSVTFGASGTITTSAVTWKKISGHAPILGTTVDYIELVCDGSGFTNGTDVNAIALISGNMAYDLASNTVTLKAGKTYRLNADIRGYGGTGTVEYAFVNSSNAELTPSVGRGMLQGDNATEGNTTGAEIIYTPTVDTIVKVRGIAGTGTYSYESRISRITIQQLGSTAFSGTLGYQTGTETLTGETWIDGKPIRRRTHTYTNLPTGATVLPSSLTLPAVTGTVVKISGVHREGASFAAMLPMVDVANGLIYSVDASLAATGVKVTLGTGRASTNSGYVAIDYTL